MATHQDPASSPPGGASAGRRSPADAASRVSSRALTAALLLASVLLALALAECLARLAAASQTGLAPRDSTGQNLYVHDPALGWRKRPSTSVPFRTLEYSTVVTTDSLGLRGPETTRAKPTGSKRILMLGDSFLEGYTVADDEIVSARLEHALESSVAAVEVLNTGTAGWATDQELLYFRPRRGGVSAGSDHPAVLRQRRLLQRPHELLARREALVRALGQRAGAQGRSRAAARPRRGWRLARPRRASRGADASSARRAAKPRIGALPTGSGRGRGLADHLRACDPRWGVPCAGRVRPLATESRR